MIYSYSKVLRDSEISYGEYLPVFTDEWNSDFWSIILFHMCNICVCFKSIIVAGSDFVFAALKCCLSYLTDAIVIMMI
ncbi:hypothetical protein Metlim_1506 [Methanoplanus limicola DSM 2279]|uniref:Uncharacterized protein n=1 Tax=Methanoplanus limicola DSM 2279 TaxID=937775 RepID=H1Z3K9_9EURY|nr:hypothetical protein Metlim_1506 [Methanoplanus limicola DSM 2279]